MRGRIAINSGIGIVQFFHDFNSHFTGTHGQTDQVFDSQPVIGNGF